MPIKEQAVPEDQDNDVEECENCESLSEALAHLEDERDDLLAEIQDLDILAERSQVYMAALKEIANLSDAEADQAHFIASSALRKAGEITNLEADDDAEQSEPD